MIKTPLNMNQYGLLMDSLKKKEIEETISDVELLILDLCHRVKYLETENRKIKSWAKRKDYF